MKNTKPKFKIADRVRSSKIYILFRKGYKPHFTDKLFETSAISTKNLLHTSSISRKRRNSGKFL